VVLLLLLTQQAGLEADRALHQYGRSKTCSTAGVLKKTCNTETTSSSSADLLHHMMDAEAQGFWHRKTCSTAWLMQACSTASTSSSSSAGLIQDLEVDAGVQGMRHRETCSTARVMQACSTATPNSSADLLHNLVDAGVLH
jgi:hypothetical protein